MIGACLVFHERAVLYIGRLGSVSAHVHAAPALLIGLNAELAVWGCPVRPTPSTAPGPAAPAAALEQAVWIPPGWCHALDGGDQPVAVLYLEPGHPMAAQGLAHYPRNQATPLPALLRTILLARLSSIWNAPHADAVRQGGHRLMRSLALHARARQSARPPQPSANRTARPATVPDTLNWLRRQVLTTATQPDGKASPSTGFSAAAARQVWLSETRLRHLFTQQVGSSMQRYRAWCRLVLAGRHAQAGASLTHAAHAAGFADQAHFSRAFRQMFGLPPSQVFAQPGTRWVDLDDLGPA